MGRVLGLFLSVVLMVLLGQRWPQMQGQLRQKAEPVSFHQWCAQEDGRYSRAPRTISKTEATNLVGILDESDSSQTWRDIHWEKGKKACTYFVTRAGTLHANAVYGRIGTDATGRPTFYSQTDMLSLGYNDADARWELIDDDTTEILYVNYSYSKIPPKSGWETMSGCTPAPIVVGEKYRPKNRNNGNDRARNNPGRGLRSARARRPVPRNAT